MVQIVDVSGWELDSTVLTKGRRQKEWLIEPHDRRYALFKLHGYHFAELAVEKLAAEIGRLLGIPVAAVELAVRDGHLGIISPRFLDADETLDEGGDLIVARDPEFPRAEARVHSFPLIEDVLAARGSSLILDFIQMLAFDALIGNSDRHHDNWGVIFGPGAAPRLAPAYDHGSSLGREIREDEIDALVQPDRLDTYARAGTCRIVWPDGSRTRRWRHLDLLRQIRVQYPAAVAAAVDRICNADWRARPALLGRMPEQYASPRRLMLIDRLVRHRVGLLSELPP